MAKPYKPTTPGRIRSILRGQAWMKSPERAKALKNSGYCCERCGVKQSKAKGKEVKVEVHHKDGIDWKGIAVLVIERILPDPSRLEVLCEDCHKDEHSRSTEAPADTASETAQDAPADAPEPDLLSSGGSEQDRRAAIT